MRCQFLDQHFAVDFGLDPGCDPCLVYHRQEHYACLDWGVGKENDERVGSEAGPLPRNAECYGIERWDECCDVELIDVLKFGVSRFVDVP